MFHRRGDNLRTLLAKLSSQDKNYSTTTIHRYWWWGNTMGTGHVYTMWVQVSYKKLNFIQSLVRNARPKKLQVSVHE